MVADNTDLTPEEKANRAAVEAFDGYFAGLKLRHFKPSEIRFMGAQHYAKGRAQGLNTLPPVKLWPMMRATILVADEARERLGSPITIISAYRSPAYNAAIRGASASYHMHFNALDLQPPQKDVARLFEILHHMRRMRMFKGGIGRYSTFIHVDTRGENKDF